MMSDGALAGGERDEFRRALDLALRWLGARARTERELRERLRQKGVPPGVVEATLERVRQWGYLDDRSFAVDYVDRALAVRHIGPRRLVEELRRRGISGSLASEVVAERVPPERVLNLARAAAQRWLRRQPEGDPVSARGRLYRFLTARGFDSETAARVVREHLGEDEAGAP
ncbi:MAG TPA: regulatory protein RecX [Thermaerobacter sp.]